ncbi:MAG: radical SAM protein [Vicinamibacterales bacterium]
MRPPAPARPRVVLYNPRAVFHTMPLALVAVGSALDRRAVDVTIVDGRLEDDPVAAVLRAADGAVVVGISVLTGAPIRDALAVSRAVKAAAPSCLVVWGGWHPSLFPADCLDEPSVDAVVVGQGELTFQDVVQRAVEGRPIAGCGGTVARDGGRVVAGPVRPLVELDRLPAHDYGLIDVEAYFARKGTRQLDYVSSQGCRFRCAFCADPAVFGRAWTGLAPERVAAELQALQARHGVDDVAFQDETFFTAPSRVSALSRELTARRVGVTWTATLRADQACRIGEAAFGAAVAAGLRRVMVGVESGSPDTLARLRKDVSLAQVREAAALLVRHDVGATFNFIVGFPGEPRSSVQASLDLAKTLRRMSPAFDTPVFYYQPYPGNPIADEAAAGHEFPRGLEAWADFDYVGGRGPWITPEVWRTVEAFTFYAKHAWRPGAWRWPLRMAARLRCEHDFYHWPIEKRLVEMVRPPEPVS